MIPHWTDKRDELRGWLLTQPRLLIGCDFDGTLSPLVQHAAQAHLPEASRDALRELSQKAQAMGANGILGVDLDFETIGGSGSMLMVIATGTAVRL